MSPLAGCLDSARTGMTRYPLKAESFSTFTNLLPQTTAGSSMLYSTNTERRNDHVLRREDGSFCLHRRQRHGGSAPKRKPLPSMKPVCIGESVPISAGGRYICDVGLYVSPAGAITVCIPLMLRDGDVPSDGILTIRRIADVMCRWTHEQIDEIAADHFYQRDRQAALVIDTMARRGLLGYSEQAGSL